MKTKIMNTPQVGIVTVIRNNDKVLLGCRKSKLGTNTWGPPGGKLDIGEEIKDCGIRELKEETNLTVTSENLKFAGVTNDIFDEETHFISLFYEVEEYEGELIAMEPNKCEKWEWFDENNLPENLFFPFRNYLNNGN